MDPKRPYSLYAVTVDTSPTHIRHMWMHKQTNTTHLGLLWLSACVQKQHICIIHKRCKNAIQIWLFMRCFVRTRFLCALKTVTNTQNIHVKPMYLHVSRNLELGPANLWAVWKRILCANACTNLHACWCILLVKWNRQCVKFCTRDSFVKSLRRYPFNLKWLSNCTYHNVCFVLIVTQ